MIKAPGLGFPRFLRKFEFCVTTFSLEFSNPRSRQSILIVSEKFKIIYNYVTVARWIERLTLV